MSETKKLVQRLRVINMKCSNAAADLLIEQDKRIESAETRATALAEEVERLKAALKPFADRRNRYEQMMGIPDPETKVARATLRRRI